MDIKTIKMLVSNAHKAGQEERTNEPSRLIADLYTEKTFNSNLIKESEIHSSEMGTFKISDIMAVSPIRKDENSASFDVWLKNNVMLTFWNVKKTSIEVERIQKKIIDSWINCL